MAPALQAEPPEPQAGTGTIKGRLVWAGGPVLAPKVPVKKGDPNVKDPVCKANDILNRDMEVDPATKGVKPTPSPTCQAGRRLLGHREGPGRKTPEVVVTQINCEYVPYATVVHTDQKLIFKSSDPVGHNVHFKPFANAPVNQMLPPNGKMTYHQEGQKRPAMAVCSIHPWMKGYVLIVDNPFAVVTKADGSFEIKDVPAGTQHLIVLLPSKGYVTEGAGKGMPVTVKAGETTDMGEIKLTK